MAASIKADALAHQCHGFLCALYASLQIYDSGIFRITALSHCDKRARTHLAQRLEVKFLVLPAFTGCEFLDTLAIGPRRQLIRRQYRQFAREQIAFRLGTQQCKAIGFLVPVQHDSGERFPVRFLLAGFPRRQQRTVDPRGIHRQFRKCALLLGIAVNRKMYLCRILFQQQLRGFAHAGLLLVSGFAQVRHDPGTQRTALEIGAHRCVADFIRFHLAPRQQGLQYVPAQKIRFIREFIRRLVQFRQYHQNVCCLGGMA